jgi:hypothetical protein
MDLEQALQVVNELVFVHCGRHLTDVETTILVGRVITKPNL